ncbi:unnamed protein product [Chrysodeixis includens]|uniref:UDP-glucose 4-epimerase n=1 Tax=Chrysodeixis includens TaxID=689277 RepID=A0A9P0BRD4_CHRIL|nr:unnamed protein product [Chrysodeixis includens]
MPRFKTILVTGGAGYIGSHCVVDLLNAGHDVIAIDNFANAVGDEEGSPALKRAEQITGKNIVFYEADLLNKPQINDIFDKHPIDCVIHFAALKAVGESMQQPLLYYQNNLLGMLNLLEIMRSHECYQMVFSSSCTVYGEPEYLPITETHPTGSITNVYGRTKYFIEEMLKDLSAADEKWNIISLRYFNPVGAHPSGLIGEDPTKEFTNLMPFMAQVALGKKPVLTVFGNDYNTPDGTGIRDYIHVMDLASGHVAALNFLGSNQVRLKVYNLGTGRGVSVKELVEVFERVTKTKIPLKYVDRRLGDITAMWADASLAKEELGWSTKLTIEEMCTDFWRWQTMNPDGYPKKSKKTSVIVNGNS